MHMKKMYGVNSNPQWQEAGFSFSYFAQFSTMSTYCYCNKKALNLKKSRERLSASLTNIALALNILDYYIKTRVPIFKLLFKLFFLTNRKQSALSPRLQCTIYWPKLLKSILTEENFTLLKFILIFCCFCFGF